VCKESYLGGGTKREKKKTDEKSEKSEVLKGEGGGEGVWERAGGKKSRVEKKPNKHKTGQLNWGDWDYLFEKLEEKTIIVKKKGGEKFEKGNK